MLLIEQLAEQRIREAQERGEFDDLPGAGKPLKLDDDAAVPQEWRAAYRVMKNAGVLPSELQLRGEIAQIEKLIAATDDRQTRAQHGRRLAYLLTRLQRDRPGSEHLQMQQVYFAKLGKRIG